MNTLRQVMGFLALLLLASGALGAWTDVSDAVAPRQGWQASDRVHLVWPSNFSVLSVQ